MRAALTKLLRHGLVYTAGAVASKVAAFFVLFPIYTHYLSPAEYGVLAMLSIMTELTAIVLGVGMSQALLRYWTKYEEPAEKRRVAATAVGTILLLGAVGIAAAVALSPYLSLVALGGREFSFALQLMFVATFFEMALLLPMDLMRAQEHSGLYVKASLVRGLANMGLTAYLIAVQRMGVLGSVWANVVVSSLAAILLLTYTVRLVGVPRIELRKLRELLAYGAPFVPIGIALYALHSVSAFFIRADRGLYEVGLFRTGFNISLMLTALVTSPFSQVWGWMMFEVARRPDAQKTVARVMTYFAATAVFCSLLLCALARDLLRIMADPRYWSAYTVVPLITLGYIFYSAEWIASTGLCIREKTSYRTYTVVGAALLSLLLNALLVPRFGMQGAAGAGALSFLALLVATAIVAGKIYPVPWETRRLLHALLVGAALVGAALATGRAFPGLWPGAPLRALIALSFPLWLLLTGFFLREELEVVQARRRPALLDSPRRRVLIISHHFPPDIQVAGRRPAHFAKYLHQAGWEVWVLTLPAHCYPLLDEDASFDYLPEARVIRVAPWRRLRPARNAAPAGNTPAHGWLWRMKSWTAGSTGLRTDELLWIRPALRAAKRLVREQQIELIFSTCFPFTCHIIARAVQRSTGCAWVADYQDPWADNPYVGGQMRWQRALRKRLEATVASHADRITIVNDYMREYLLGHAPYLDPAKVLTINLSFDPDEIEASRALCVPRNPGRMLITYTGSLTSYRSPKVLLDAVALLLAEKRLPRDEIELRFMGVDDMGEETSLEQMVAERGLSEVVTFYGIVTHKEALAHQLAADVLLYLQTKKGGGNIFASAKLYEYLGTGKTILAICEESMATELLRQTGGGIFAGLDCPQEIAAAIAQCYQTWRAGKQLPRPRPAVVESLQEPGPTERLAALFEELLSARCSSQAAQNDSRLR